MVFHLCGKIMHLCNNAMLNYFYWDPNPAMFNFDLPLLGRPILWYGFFFALGFFLGYWVLVYLLRRYFIHVSHFSKKEINVKAAFFAERIALYVIIGTIVGARLGDVLFYQDWSAVQKDPMILVRFWEGGLASHGGAVGVFRALFLFSRRYRKAGGNFSFLRVLDLVVIPAALGACFIRLGNFFNQEILGAFTKMPWGVIFGHPVDGGPALPRHPVQLYESLWYLLTFCILFLYSRKNPSLHKPGKICGLFFILVFGFRFLIEFLKVEQSVFINSTACFRMGQYLSLPFIAVGIYFLMRKNARSER